MIALAKQQWIADTLDLLVRHLADGQAIHICIFSQTRHSSDIDGQSKMLAHPAEQDNSSPGWGNQQKLFQPITAGNADRGDLRSAHLASKQATAR